MDFGQWLKQKRQALDLTQDTFAEADQLRRRHYPQDGVRAASSFAPTGRVAG